jgi:hypothetical protein
MIFPLVELTQRSSSTRALPLTSKQLVNLMTPEDSCRSAEAEGMGAIEGMASEKWSKDQRIG